VCLGNVLCVITYDCQSNSVQEDTCLINGNCYDDGEPNPENPLQSCNATSSGTEWTKIVTTERTTVVIDISSTATGEFIVVY